MDTLVSFKTIYKDEPLEFEIIIDENNNDLNVRFNIITDDSPIMQEFNITVNGQNGSITMQSILGLGPLESCMIACGVSGILKPLISCYNSNIKEYIKCLKSKGIEISEEVIPCIIACVVGT